MRNVFIGIDVGGSWLKGVSLPKDGFDGLPVISRRIARTRVYRVPSKLGVDSTVEDFIDALDKLLSRLVAEGDTVAGIGVSTAGIVDYPGRNLLVAAPHLAALRSPVWREYLEKRCNAPVVLVNDADAAATGAAAAGYLTGADTIGVMPVGTGVGFSLWRNGRRWAPGKTLPLIGSINTPAGSFDAVGGVSRIAGLVGGDLCALFTLPEFETEKDRYLDGLAGIIFSAIVIYRVDTLLIGGGLADAAIACGYPLAEKIMERIEDDLASLGLSGEVKVMPEGNRLPLIGAVLLAVGENDVKKICPRKEYSNITTEMPLDPSAALHEMSTHDLVDLMWNAEQEAGKALEASLGDIARAADVMAEKLSGGGRLIYVGSGTSGRLAAIDAVELACTFGFPRERAFALIAGGVSDAAVEIEDDFEEGASGIPEILLAAPGPKDVVVGVSTSGSAYYVRSALAVARQLKAYTIFIQESAGEGLPFVDANIALRSGNEVIAGSTRMKAGTATKKVLNFLSTTAMIRMGKVYGPYMVGME